MQEKEVFRFEKSGNNSKGFWVFVTLGFIALFFGGFSSIAGLVMMGYGVHLLTKKNKIIFLYYWDCKKVKKSNLQNRDFTV